MAVTWTCATRAPQPRPLPPSTPVFVEPYRCGLGRVIGQCWAISAAVGAIAWWLL